MGLGSSKEEVLNDFYFECRSVVIDDDDDESTVMVDTYTYEMMLKFLRQIWKYPVGDMNKLMNKIQQLVYTNISFGEDENGIILTDRERERNVRRIQFYFKRLSKLLIASDKFGEFKRKKGKWIEITKQSKRSHRKARLLPKAFTKATNTGLSFTVY